jgi:hypothetical protein
MLYISVYAILDFSFLGLQLTFQYLLPILVGVVASGFSYSQTDLQWLFSRFMYLCILILVFFLYRFLFHEGYSPDAAAAPMLLSVAISLLLGLYFITRVKINLLFIAVFSLIPILNVTRMGIFAITVIIILHFANRELKKKLMVVFIGIAVLLIIFHSRSFQEKTFFKGEGKISDLMNIYNDNSNVNWNGRISLKNSLISGLKESPLLGNGPRADNVYLAQVTGHSVGEAHNDYLSVRFNYGYLGLSLLLAGFISTFISLYSLSKRYSTNEYIFLLSTSVLTLFFSFFLFMFSDNILKYTIFFPNYFFALVGIVYSLKKDNYNSYSSHL